MSVGSGVSVTGLGDGRWRVRWRELVLEAGTRRRVQRERVVYDEADALRLRDRVHADLAKHGAFLDVVAGEVRDTVASFDEAATGWIRHLAARGSAEGTIAKYAATLDRFFAD